MVHVPDSNVPPQELGRASVPHGSDESMRTFTDQAKSKEMKIYQPIAREKALK